MQLSQRSLIDKLLKDVYSDEPPYNLKDDKGYTMLALQFALADTKNLVLRAHQLLNEQCVTIYTLQEVSTAPDTLVLCLSPRSLVIVEDKQKFLVDLDQWFCSCEPFVAKFNAVGATSVPPTAEMIQYGNRRHTSIQFDLVKTDKGQGQTKEDKVPICEHLLALYLFKLHPKKLSHYLQVVNITPELFISLTSQLLV